MQKKYFLKSHALILTQKNLFIIPIADFEI